jgi:hypothetical protein
MSRPLGFFLSVIVLSLAALAASPASLNDEDENYRQLQAMPRERRIALLENLERFDKLDPSEQKAIRKLNAEIAKRDPVAQLRYRSLIHRYHSWANGLTEDQKQALKSTEDPEARFKLAKTYRLKEKAGPAPGPRVFGIRTGYFGLVGPHEGAYLLRVWNRLTPAKKTEIERQPEHQHLFAEIRALGKTVGVQSHGFPLAEDRVYDSRLDGDETFKKQLGQYAKRVDVASKKSEAAANKCEPVPKRFELRFTEFLHFEDHKPKPVSQQNLERFSASCPNWFHAMLDPLSPDEARNYLTILYRQIYTDNGEFPSDTKATKSSTAPTPGANRPSSKKSGPAAPF